MEEEKYNRRFLPELTYEQKQKITEYFFGPFDPKWFDEKGILNNSDRRIAEDLGVELTKVAKFTTTLIENHFKNISKQYGHTK